MSVLVQLYSIVGTMHGQVLIMETGYCTDEQSTVSALQSQESGRVNLEPIPRAEGITAKALDNRTLKTSTLRGAAIGSRANCLQIGRTVFTPAAPRQPVEPFKNKEILHYTRIWIQLEE